MNVKSLHLPLLVALLFAFTFWPFSPAAAQPKNPAPAEQNSEFGLQEAITQLIARLAEREEFATWKNAQWETYPLGPGLHGWVVIISAGHKEAGYLVVTAARDDERHFVLTEYGLGEFPLFSQSTLYRTLRDSDMLPQETTLAAFLKQNAIAGARFYPNPLHAVWRVMLPDSDGEKGPVYIDAKTGEEYPAEAKAVEELAKNSALPPGAPLTATITQSLTLPEFDPYADIGWVVGKPADIKNLQDLLGQLQTKKRLTYVASLFADQVTTPFAVTGFHTWEEGEPFIRLEQDGARFIPFSALARWGKYYE